MLRMDRSPGLNRNLTWFVQISSQILYVLCETSTFNIKRVCLHVYYCRYYRPSILSVTEFVRGGCRTTVLVLDNRSPTPQCKANATLDKCQTIRTNVKIPYDTVRLTFGMFPLEKHIFIWDKKSSSLQLNYWLISRAFILCAPLPK